MQRQGQGPGNGGKVRGWGSRQGGRLCTGWGTQRQEGHRLARQRRQGHRAETAAGWAGRPSRGAQRQGPGSGGWGWGTQWRQEVADRLGR